MQKQKSSKYRIERFKGGVLHSVIHFDHLVSALNAIDIMKRAVPHLNLRLIERDTND